MFDFFKKNPEEEQPSELRDLLFGDCPISAWPADGSAHEAEPWVSFVEARMHLAAGRRREGEDLLRHVLALPGLESRHYLQAWHFLRQAGVQPDAGTAKEVLGVVVEVGLEKGTDVVAAYADGTARYLNQGGGVIVWEAPDESKRGAILRLLAAGREVVERIGPWLGERPPAPREGGIRINMLTPSGLHFGEADFATLAGDPLGGPVVTAALALMNELIAETESGRYSADEGGAP